MGKKKRLQIRCSEQTREEWDKTFGEVRQLVGTHGEFAEEAALFIRENKGEFEQFVSGSRKMTRKGDRR